MAEDTGEQSAENREYLRRLLKQKQPAFYAALELAADLVELDLLCGGKTGSAEDPMPMPAIARSSDPPTGSQPNPSLAETSSGVRRS